MRFKDYLNECECDMPQVAPSEVSPIDHSSVNYRLADALDKEFLSPESGIQAIRKVLGRFDLELPALYGASTEGDELVLELENVHIYILYYLTDDNRYEFYAEVGDEETMNDLMSDEETDEEE